jgi:hypothetical protein
MVLKFLCFQFSIIVVIKKRIEFNELFFCTNNGFYYIFIIKYFFYFQIFKFKWDVHLVYSIFYKLENYFNLLSHFIHVMWS